MMSSWFRLSLSSSRSISSIFSRCQLRRSCPKSSPTHPRSACARVGRSNDQTLVKHRSTAVYQPRRIRRSQLALLSILVRMETMRANSADVSKFLASVSPKRLKTTAVARSVRYSTQRAFLSPEILVPHAVQTPNSLDDPTFEHGTGGQERRRKGRSRER